MFKALKSEVGLDLPASSFALRFPERTKVWDGLAQISYVAGADGTPARVVILNDKGRATVIGNPGLLTDPIAPEGSGRGAVGPLGTAAPSPASPQRVLLVRPGVLAAFAAAATAAAVLVIIRLKQRARHRREG